MSIDRLTRSLRKLKSTRPWRARIAGASGATNGEYALMLAVLAMLTVAAVSIFGKDVAKLFEKPLFDANQVAQLPAAQEPSIFLSVDTPSVPSSGQVVFKWSTEKATTVSAAADYSGTCQHGSTHEALGWSGVSGQVTIPWSPALAGCQMRVTLTAGNTMRTGSATAATAFAGGNATPQNFAFDPATNLEISTLTTSGAVSVSGVDYPALISVSGGSLSIDGGPWENSGSAPEGSSVRLQSASPDAFSTTKFVSFQAGNATGTWTLTTRAQDTTPDQFTFPDIAAAEPGATIITKSDAALAGFEGSLVATASNGALLSTDGSSFASTVNVHPGDSIWVQVIASATADGSGTVTTTVSIGGTSQSLTVETKDETADTIAFAPTTNADPSTQVNSDAISVAGFVGTLPAAATNGLVSINGGAPSTSGTVAPGNTVQLVATSPASYDATLTPTPTLVIGSGQTASWTLTTRSQDKTPDSFGFPAIAKADPGSTVTTKTSSSLSGFDGPLTATASNGALLSVDGVSFATTVNVNPGQSLWVQLVAAAATDGSGTATTTVSVGTASQTLTLISRDTSPDAISFAPTSGVDPNTPTYSGTVTLGGFDGTLQAVATNALVSINGNAPVAAGPVATNDKVQLVATSSGTFLGTLAPAPSLTIGAGQAANWSLSTRDKYVSPTDFTFVNPGKANPGATTTLKSAATLSGFDGALPVTATNGALVSNDGATFLPKVNITVGQFLYVQEVASTIADGTGSVSTTVSIGDYPKVATVQTKDQTPDALTFTPSSNNFALDTVASNKVTIAGIPDGAVTMKVTSATTSAQFKINTGAWTNATVAGATASVNQNDSLQLQVTTSPTNLDTITVSFYDSRNQLTGTSSWTIASLRKVVKTTGGLYTFVVPSGVTSITTKTWAAGGGAFFYDASNYGLGGAGGYTTATISVQPGDVLSIYVGSAGGKAVSGYYGGGGGGATAITKGTSTLTAAGGGAGAALAAGATVPSFNGGLGGGASGTRSSVAIAGAAATSTGPGAGGVGSRRTGASGSGHDGGAGAGVSAGNGGSGWGYGSGGTGGLPGSDIGSGGGGGGYYGGGGGGGDIGGAPGGGGSGYASGPGVSGSTTTGTGNIPANTGDSDYTTYSGNAGKGGNATGSSGFDGMAVINY